MKTYKIYQVLLISMFILLLSSSCSKEDKLIMTEFKIDSADIGIKENSNFKTDIKKINGHFLGSIRNDFPISWQNYKIKDTYFENNRNTEFIRITFEINGKLLSKSYLNEFSNDKRANGKIIEIDCSGNCGTNAGEKICTEQYNINKGSVTCACQSDNCKMTITQVIE